MKESLLAIGRLRRWFLCSLCISVSLCTSSADDSSKEEPNIELTAERETVLGRQLDQLASSDKLTDAKVLEDVQKELHKLLGSKIDESKGTAYVDEQVKSRTRLFIKLVATVDSRIDPNFKFKTYGSKVIPPTGANVLPGAPASAVKNLTLRQEYSKAVVEHKLALEKQIFQRGMRRIRAASHRYLIPLHRHYFASTTGKQDFMAIVEKNVDNEKLRSDILKTIDPNSESRD